MKNTATLLFYVVFLISPWLVINPAAVAQVGACEEGTAQAILETGNIRARMYNNSGNGKHSRQDVQQWPLILEARQPTSV